MRNTTLLLMLVAAMVATAAPAGARELYAGLRFGTADPSDQPELEGSLKTVGLFVGGTMASYRATQLSVQIQTDFPVSDEPVSLRYSNAYGLSSQQLEQATRDWSWDMWTMSLYNVARVGRDRIYVMGKLGLVYERVAARAVTEHVASDLGIGFGAGLGFRPTPRLLIETEVSMIDKNAAYLGLSTAIAF